MTCDKPRASEYAAAWLVLFAALSGVVWCVLLALWWSM